MALKFRRGTTAQQSGSLAFGEPYVNTTLGTLVVGGQTGDIVLSTSGTGSTGNFGAISGSGLDITGNANIAGNVTVGGKLTIGDATSDTVNVVASLSSSLIPQTTNVFDLGSAQKIWRDLYISTGSIKFVTNDTVVKELTLSTIQGLESATGSSNDAINALNAFTASQLTQNSALATISGSLISSASAAKTKNDSQDVSITNLNSTSASVNTSVASLNSFSASQLTQNSALATISGSLISTASANVVAVSNLNATTASLNTSVSNLNSFSSSQLTQNSALATVTGSLISSASNLTQRVAANEAVSGTYARTNSANTFTGNQIVSGSMTVTQDLVVLGSSSIQNISSSNLVIGAAFVTVNTATPVSRYAGLRIIDSGSSGGSGSFLYDAEQDEFIFVHRGNGINVTSSHFVLGPETYDNLGNETYLTNNRLPKGTGKEHLVDGQITDDGTTVSIAGNLVVTGSITAPQWSTLATYTGSVEGRFSTLATLTGSNATRLTNLETTSASVNTSIANINVATASLQTTSASVNTSVSSINSFTASQLTQNSALATITGSLITSVSVNTVSFANVNPFTASVLTQLSTLGTYTGSVEGRFTTLATYTGSVEGRFTTLATYTGSVNTSIANINVATASLQTTSASVNTSVTNLNTTTASLNTSVSNLNTTTGSLNTSVSNINTFTASLSTTSNVRFGSLGIGMAASGTSGRIDAAGDIVAFSTSDRNFKENITPIPNAIEKIRKISGNTYDWKADMKDIHGFEGNDVGVIAQEIEEVLPQLVTTRETGYKAVKYDKLVALLIEGIKEQQQHIDNLTIQVEELKKQKGL